MITRVERLHGELFKECDVRELRAGDYFKVTKNGRTGPLLKAVHDAKEDDKTGQWSVGVVF